MSRTKRAGHMTASDQTFIYAKAAAPHSMPGSSLDK
jgi:hypothetical protein